jgi:hypothetical protein
VAGGAQGEGRSSRRRIAALALTFASPLVAWLIVKAAASAMSGAAAVALAPLPPASPAPMLKYLAAIMQQPKLKVSSDMQRTARDGLAALPLSFEPFLVGARAAEQKGDVAHAIALLEEARRRRPSHPAVRMQLMIYYTRSERFPEALNEVDVILRRSSELRPALLPELTKLISDPRGRAALATILARNPDWRPEFFAAANARKVATSDARDLYERIKAIKPRGDLSFERQLILQTQASAGDYSGARQTWLAGLPEGERASSRFMSDGAFRGVAAPKPFGWDFKEVDAGRAEPAKDGPRTYLDVAYFGGQAMTLAEQTLALRPGSYTLRLNARSPSGLASAQLYWRVSCQPGGTRIGLLNLAQAAADDRRFGTNFTVPASGCPGQSLALVAEPGDVAAAVSLEVSRMEIGQ